nr:hypothetical protein [Tanacetum cinerariifolium]
MSLDNAQSTVTYTSISSDSDEPSWGIPLMNAAEFPKIDPYEEVSKQRQVEDDDEDPKEDPSEEHEPKDNDDEDPNEEHEPEDEDTKEPSENFDETKPFEEDETAITPPPRHCRARISVRLKTPMAASTQALIDAFAAGSSPFPLLPTSSAYDQASEHRMMTSIEEVNLRVSYQAQ